MGNLDLYFREQPGAALEKPVKILGTATLLAALFTTVLLLGLLTSSFANFFPAKMPAPTQSSQVIGIVNPRWVENKTFRVTDDGGKMGYFDSATGGLIGTLTPPKYVFVTPSEAQLDLERLIKLGYVTAAGAAPDVVRDFAVLKKLGITIENTGIVGGGF